MNINSGFGAATPTPENTDDHRHSSYSAPGTAGSRCPFAPMAPASGRAEVTLYTVDSALTWRQIDEDYNEYHRYPTSSELAAVRRDAMTGLAAMGFGVPHPLADFHVVRAGVCEAGSNSEGGRIWPWAIVFRNPDGAIHNVVFVRQLNALLGLLGQLERITSPAPADRHK